MLALYVRITNWLRAQDGQDLIEYALLAGLISLVAVGIIATVGEDVAAVFTGVSGELQEVPLGN